MRRVTIALVAFLFLTVLTLPALAQQYHGQWIIQGRVRVDLDHSLYYRVDGMIFWPGDLEYVDVTSDPPGAYMNTFGNAGVQLPEAAMEVAEKLGIELDPENLRNLGDTFLIDLGPARKNAVELGLSEISYKIPFVYSSTEPETELWYMDGPEVRPPGEEDDQHTEWISNNPDQSQAIMPMRAVLSNEQPKSVILSARAVAMPIQPSVVKPTGKTTTTWGRIKGHRR